MMNENEGEIPVRLNRCIRLRQMHSSSKGNLSVVAQHHKAEGSTRVSGQNKAMMRNLQRELLTWHREQSILLEKMNRYQNSAYDRWVKIEKMKELASMRAEKKQEFEKVREEAIEDRRSSQVALKMAISKIQTEITINTEEEKEQSNENKIIDQTKEVKTQINDSVIETEVHTKVVTQSEECPQHDSAITTVSSKSQTVESQPTIAPCNPKASPSTKVRTLPGSLFPSRESNRLVLSSKSGAMDTLIEDNTIQVVPLPPRRSITYPRLMSSSRSCLPGPRDRKSATAPATTQATSNSLETSIVARRLDRPQLARSATVCSPRKGESPVVRPSTQVRGERTPRTAHSRVPDHSMEIDEDFTCWRKTKDGTFVAVATPYSRRKFRSPKKRDPKMIERMLEKEGSVQTSNKNKFKNLCREIDQLHKFNPLSEVKRLFPEFDINKNDNDSVKAAGMGGQSQILFKLMKAFGAVDKFVLDGLDPNTPEALRVCRYLRLKKGSNAGEDAVFADIHNLKKKTTTPPETEAKVNNPLEVDADLRTTLPNIEKTTA